MQPRNLSREITPWTQLDVLEERVLLAVNPALLDGAPFVEGVGWAISDGLFVAPSSADLAGDGSAGTAESATLASSAYSPEGKAPYGADYRDGTEYMLGSVYVTLVLLESDGTIDASTENWTATQISQVKAEAQEGLTWWEQTFAAQNLGSPHALSFTLDTTYADAPVVTGYEPISRPYSYQSYWIDDFLDVVGYNTSANIWDDLDRWNHAQRLAHNTDWAYTVFVNNSYADTDGKYSDGYFAYAYLGGPFLVMTYDNNGWGISRMGQVLAHETGHVFYALDEYPGSNTYTSTSGYYNIQNLNAYDGNPSLGTRVASIMAESSLQNAAYAAHTSSPTSLQMIGWRDLDGDKVMDVLDVPLSLSGSGSYNAAAGTYTFSGTSSVNTLANLNPYGTRHNITLNTVNTLQYRIDGGNWISGSTYYDYVVSVAQTIDVSALVGGSHTVDFRTVVDATGVASNIVSNTLTLGPAQRGVTVSTASITTFEDRKKAAATFSVVLTAQPTAEVTISISSSDTTEGTVSTPSLTFTPSNWNVAQVVSVKGMDDNVKDGNVAYSILTGDVVSNDAGYNGMGVADVTAVNMDNERGGGKPPKKTTALKSPGALSPAVLAELAAAFQAEQQRAAQAAPLIGAKPLELGWLNKKK